GSFAWEHVWRRPAGVPGGLGMPVPARGEFTADWRNRQTISGALGGAEIPARDRHRDSLPGPDVRDSTCAARAFLCVKRLATGPARQLHAGQCTAAPASVHYWEGGDGGSAPDSG